MPHSLPSNVMIFRANAIETAWFACYVLSSGGEYLCQSWTDSDGIATHTSIEFSALDDREIHQIRRSTFFVLAL